MPLPFILGAAAALAGIVGAGAGINGAVQMKDANDTMKAAQRKQNCAVERFEQRNKTTTELMDSIGKKELEILNSFSLFSDYIEKIQNRPEFKVVNIEGIVIQEYNEKELRDVAVGANALLGGLAGAGVGTAGGFAAAGATTAAVMALGTASTGTAISTLSGVAATNAALAALGGGSLAAGGGGMALGSAILGGATLGVGLLVGGIIFSATGSKLSDKADEAYDQAVRTEKEVNKIISYFDELDPIARRFKDTLLYMNSQYSKRLNKLQNIINTCYGRINWYDLSTSEQLIVQDTTLLVSILYDMCKVKLVKQAKDKNSINEVNHYVIEEAINKANKGADGLQSA